MESDRPDFLSPESRKMFARVLRAVADALEEGAPRENILGLCGSTSHIVSRCYSR